MCISVIADPFAMFLLACGSLLQGYVTHDIKPHLRCPQDTNPSCCIKWKIVQWACPEMAHSHSWTSCAVNKSLQHISAADLSSLTSFCSQPILNCSSLGQFVEVLAGTSIGHPLVCQSSVTANLMS